MTSRPGSTRSGTLFDFPAKKQQLEELTDRMGDPNFWTNSESAQKVVAELKTVKSLVDPLEKVAGELEDAEALWELAEEADDEAARRETVEQIRSLSTLLEKVELASLLNGENDAKACFFGIQAGAGGTEACDWAAMLLRMYTRYFDHAGYKYEQVEMNAGEQAGVQSVTLRVTGPFAYGYLSCEAGVHRLVRISPFDAQHRRHTTFAAVSVLPEMEDAQIEIRSEDIELEFIRSSGPGGQHVNKTSSAVRITHKPSGIAVFCQNERSQHQNRQVALGMLRSRLAQVEQAKRDAELAKIYDERGEIAWGNQIRNYVLQPYQQVKDRRTGLEVGNPQSVLDGDLDAFIAAYLRHRASLRK